jgi:c-di-GMP phosphodiesterase
MTIPRLKSAAKRPITRSIMPAQRPVSPARALELPPREDVLVARQPILDRRLEVMGYELLYRTSENLGAADPEHAEQATSRVIADAFGELGLERLVGARPAFVNLTREFLLTVRPLPLAPGRVVLELLEDQLVDDELLEVLREVVGKGFALALDDFVYDESQDPLLELASIVKVDVRALAQEEVFEQFALLRDRGVKTIAEKVETLEEYETYRDAGFDYFQGYFYARPSVVHRQRVPEAIGSLGDIQSAGGDFDSVQRVILRDVGLSYRLLRYANSAFIGLPTPVGSVREALVRLGARTVQQWATMLVLAGLPGKPHQLVATALLRARMCQLAVPPRNRHLMDRLFTVGMFSVIDALLDMPMEEALTGLPLDDDVTTALLGGDSVEGDVLKRVLAYERGDFDALDLDGEDDILARVYPIALAWADAAAQGIG